jgi:hypothetical protein
MEKARFTKDGCTIEAHALNSAGMGFLVSLVMRGWYTESEAFDLCFEFENKYVSITVIN